MELSEWVNAALSRTGTAFFSAKASTDRIALIRSWVHLLGGRINLEQNKIQLTAEEIELLRRFGLSLTDAGRAVRILEENDPKELPVSVVRVFGTKNCVN